MLKLLFAWRYFKSEKSVNAINIISWISVLAIAVVVAALIIVFSVFNGFEDLVKGLYADFYADLSIFPSKGKIIVLTKQQLQQLKGLEGVEAISLEAEEKAVLVNGDYQSIVTMKGVDEKQSLINNIGTHIVRGKYELGTLESPNLIVGVGTENAVGIDVEKGVYPLTLYMPNRKELAHFGTVEGMNAYKINPVGTFMVQQDFDNKYVFTNLAFMKYMLDMKPDDYSACEVKLNPHLKEDRTIKNIQNLLGNNYQLQTRYQQNQSLYTAMQVEKWVIYGVTCLILMVAAFNIIGALTMLVLEKQKDIAVLKAMGASESTIQQIFLSEGVLLSITGGAIGIVLASVICIAQMQFHLIKLEGGTFLIDYYPVKLLASDYAIVFCTVLIIAVVAAWLPARKAGKQILSLKS
ncbi:ABC transporter permease [Parasediminibacterium sp. JCM 36343]|uniref:ABC transporter permease n=1 Tax=Parasediminibacterium sp. JCM 36343 TaxID=3374279 RepID=UPI00397AA385